MTHTPTPPAAARLTTMRDAARYAGEWVAFQGALRGVPGIQACVRYRGEVLLDLAWGIADVSTGEALTTDHLFRVASHSKTFTATAVLQLVERGLLRLDDRVGERLPELAGSAIAQVTVRELLGHQGGVIRDGVDADYWQRGGAFPDRETLLALCLDDAVVFSPNEHFKYSNIGYGLLGLIIEAVSGSGYGEYVTENIVVPLGLTRSGPEWVDERATEFAAGHTALVASTDARRTIGHVDTRALAAATGWFSTAAELSAYAAAHRFGDATLISDASKRLMQRAESSIEAAGVTRHYGLGFDVHTVGERQLVGHSGGYPGHITRTWLDPVDGLAVTVLTNALDGPVDVLAGGILGIIDLALRISDEPDSDTQGARIGTPAAAAEAGAEVSDVRLEPDADAVDLSTFEGRFANLWGVHDTVRLGGRLVGLNPRVPDPVAWVERYTVEGPDILRLASRAGFHAPGEAVVVERADDGSISTVRSGGMTSWPIERFESAMDSDDPSTKLGRLSL